MDTQHLTPSQIEKKSFEIISETLSGMDIMINGQEYMPGRSDDPYEEVMLSVIKRCIHTTADFDYAKNMYFSEGSIERFSELIRSGATIVTDTNMALSGINRKTATRFGCKLYCFMADEDVAIEAGERKITRATVSMERAMKLEGPVIFVIGNAPTALMTLKELYDRRDYIPAFVVGMPVGFVNVVSAKEMIMQTDIPYIIGSGRKGGSNVAAAVVNAILYSMSDKAENACISSGEGRENRILSEETGGASVNKGFTTGSCAAAAAKAAAFMLLDGRKTDKISIDTPSGVRYETELTDVMLTCDDGTENTPRADQKVVSASCAVRKPECDDPDVTAGMLIYAKAEYANDDSGRECHALNRERLYNAGSDDLRVIIEGGKGIGKLTKPGLDREVGEYAINSVPRRMITSEVLAVMEEYDYQGALRIEISAPEGEKIAEKTFNHSFGIEGGISIIGTSGLVEPMSTTALIDTIHVSLRQQKAMGSDVVVVSPGNYGLDYLVSEYGYDPDRIVKCSNFIGETIDLAVKSGFSGMLLTGHIGKLVKVSGGIMNTHSSEADCRMELLASAAAKCGADTELIGKILDCASTEEACGYVIDAGMKEGCFDYLIRKIQSNLIKRSKCMEIGCIIYSTRYGQLGMTDNAASLMERAGK